MLPGARAAIDEFAPDVVLADQQALAVRSPPPRPAPVGHVVVDTGSLAEPATGMPKITAWIRQLQEAVRTHGCLHTTSASHRISFIAFTIPELPPRRRRAAATSGRRKRGRRRLVFPGRPLDGRPLVVVTLGTSKRARRPGVFSRKRSRVVANGPCPGNCGRSDR